MITLGILSLFQIEVDLTIVASLMSVIGYSLNDSIVVSDRIRENFRKIRRGTSYEIMNVSLTQTLSRTIMTSATTLLVVLMLYIFGGSMLKGFCISTENGHETRTPDCSKSGKRGCRSDNTLTLIERFSDINIANTLPVND